MIEVFIPLNPEFQKYKTQVKELYEKSQERLCDPNPFSFVKDNTLFYIFVKNGVLLGAIYYFMEDNKLFLNGFASPKHHVEKIYHVKIKGEIEPEKLAELNSPMIIDDYKIKPVKVTIIERKEGNTILKFVLNEGRNRQIRKMCEQAELSITRLKRVAVGDLTIGMLSPGKWKYMNYNEISYLKNL